MSISGLTRVKFILVLFFSACTTPPTAPLVKSPVTLLAPTMDSLLTESDRPFYIQKSCRYLTADLKMVKSLPGFHCVETKTGVIISNEKGIRSIDNKLNLQWKIEPFFTHHQLNPSEVDDSLLALTSEYAASATRPIKQIRYDVLVVIKDGKIVKSFGFRNYLKKKNLNGILTAKNNWTTDIHKDNSLEETHVNSLREIFTVSNGQKILKGYVAYDMLRRQVFIFDTSLKKVVRVLDFRQRKVHDVRQYSENELIFFLNENFEEPLPRQSKIETYNLVTNEFKILYQSEKIKIVYPWCGAVVPMERNRLLINYSRCNAVLEGAATDSYFEMVDLNSKKSVLAQSETELLGTDVSIVRRLPDFPL